uniref:glutathione-specific gamma-glutamylcyclotransferase n=1 Tax=Ascaris lumbricoides TaxID=6252 RepID=A0A0M3IDI8_ASCLU
MPKILESFTTSENAPTLWIFGYGSLIWNTGFSYDESLKAIAHGYSLRMYQGNIFHRGDTILDDNNYEQLQPGRVATLIEDKQSYACGLVFRVTGRAKINAALEHLHEREVLNGYEFNVVPVEALITKDGNESTARITALTCIANANNEFYLGPGSLDEIGEQIALAKGCAGPNSDYLFRLVDAIRTLFPNYCDNHIFALEGSVMERRQRA